MVHAFHEELENWGKTEVGWKGCTWDYWEIRVPFPKDPVAIDVPLGFKTVLLPLDVPTQSTLGQSGK